MSKNINTGMKKQKGIALLGLMIAMGIISTLFAISANGIVKKQMYDQQALPFKDRLTELQKALENYQIYQYNNGVNLASKDIFPSDRSLDVFYKDLAIANVTASCTEQNENDGKCVRLLTTPWAEGTESRTTVKYEVKTDSSPSGVVFPYIEITFDLPNARIYPNQNAVYETILSTLPNTQVISWGSSGSIKYSNKIKWRIDRVSDMPALDLMVEDLKGDFVVTDGTSKLINDWDVGNQAITNTKDVSIRLQNGKQQRLGIGMVGYFLGRNNDYLNKHSCAVGLTPDLILSVKDLNAFSNWAKYSASGSFFLGHEEVGNRWKLTLIHNVKRIEDNKWWAINDGWVNVQRICRK